MKTGSRMGKLRPVLWLLAAVWVVVTLFHMYKPLPPGLNVASVKQPVTHVRFLSDITYGREGEENTRFIEQQIFNEIMAMIANAQHFILVDMFLFNDFQGQVSEHHRKLSSELANALIQQKQRYPDMEIQVISDPLNTVYGGRKAEHFQLMEAEGIKLTLTDLTRLRDSNPLYSGLWRLLFKPFGNSEGASVPNPFGEGKVSIRSYLALFNFKANHRKLIISDQQGSAELVALVTSANPHDGSSAHGNVALRFSGSVVLDLLASELAVLAFSGSPPLQTDFAHQQVTASSLSMEVVTERSVEHAVLDIINTASAGESLDFALFYLSDRHIIRALIAAAERGVQVRMLLDPNKDAFGREKNGVPNRPVAAELTAAGINVRWCATQGEQCHAKWLLHRNTAGQASMLLGSTNFTRRNMHNLNLETSVILHGDIEQQPLQEGLVWFENQWFNRDGRVFSADYERYADNRFRLRLMYRVMEATGLSTF